MADEQAGGTAVENWDGVTSGDGSGSGTPSSTSNGAADTSADELQRTEQRRRDLQSQLDRERARNADLEKRLQAKPEDGATPPALDAAAVDRLIQQRLASERQAAAYREELRKRYPQVNVDALDANEGHEAMEARARAAQASADALRKQLREEAEVELRREYEAAFGRLPAAAPAGDAAGGTKRFTAEQVAAMSLQEMTDAGITAEDLKRLSHTGSLD